MAFISLTFLVIVAFGSLDFPQTRADCGAYNSDLWKEDRPSSEGSCSRPSLEDVGEDIPETKDEEVRTEAKESSFIDVISKIFNFIWMIYKWYTNSNTK